MIVKLMVLFVIAMLVLMALGSMGGVR